MKYITKHFDNGFFVLILTINTLIILSLDNFPYADGINHIARYTLIQGFLAGEHSPLEVIFEYLPTSYLAIDLIAVYALKVVSPQTVGLLIAILALTLPAIGIRVLLSTVNPKQSGLSIGASILSFNWCFFYGFMNYLIGVGLALMFISLWWIKRKKHTKNSIILLSLLSIILYSVHMSAIAIVLVIIGTMFLIGLFNAYKNKLDTSISIKYVKYDLTVLISIIATVLILMILSKLSLPSSTTTAGVYDLIFRTPIEKTKQIFSLFYIFSTQQFLLLLFSYIASIALIFFCYYKKITNYLFIIASILFFIIFLIFPVQFMGAYDADIRFLLPAMLLLFLAISNQSLPKWLPLSLFILSLLHSYIIHTQLQVIDQKLNDYSSIIKLLPKESKVMSFNSAKAIGRVDIYRHFNLWHIIRNNGYSNGIFHYEQHGPHMAHISLVKTPYSIGDQWDSSQTENINWERISTEYEYIIDAGSTSKSTLLLEKRFTKISNKGSISLYRINKR